LDETPVSINFCALLTIALVRTVEVVVPSPASSAVFAEASLII